MNRPTIREADNWDSAGTRALDSVCSETYRMVNWQEDRQ